MVSVKRRKVIVIMKTAPHPQAFTAVPVQKLAYTVKELSIALGLGKTRIYELFAQKKLAAHKCGGRTLVAASEVDRFMKTWTPLEIF